MGFLLRLVVFFYLWVFFTAQGQKKEESSEEVKIEVLHRPENCSKTSKKGDLLNAHYDGYLAKDGSKFYCSRTQNEGHPKWFVLGVGQVIKGLDIAMMDMCPGERRKVLIPPSFAYGKEGYAEGKIPPDATLIFEIELYAVTKGPRSIETFKQIDTNNDKQLSKAEGINKDLPLKHVDWPTEEHHLLLKKKSSESRGNLFPVCTSLWLLNPFSE
ncbi:peptidyl-prolyl cis-trans isomerase FKBP7 isoform X3 [Tupaia chinensis]|uniref:peptidyl-prolyl cis-trans isomerase FKBP7 isoform X3 n=1 Tax=Tupaia chinensis TaxID=246437 RepID=UPI0003C8DC39|nr:peptidyl-prolyl cis-trans isomerase FKBP7 isoform X3 [Tupaia chinensis]XP_006151716.1 peptidyl-prolyl cis-trans isomerase FKBP7 isoform X3 [Tupaia chinensis]